MKSVKLPTPITFQQLLKLSVSPKKERPSSDRRATRRGEKKRSANPDTK